MTDLSLAGREGLPDALRVLLADYPKEAWEKHPEFGQLTRFWLDRHIMFRRLCSMMTDEAQAALDGGMDPERHAAHVSRLGGMLYGDLHGHHRIEDMHYFPQLVRLEPPLEHGFDLLEGDHGAMDGLLTRFAEDANAVIGRQGNQTDNVACFLENLRDFTGLLVRHLTDEEELVVPVILKHGERALGG